jgi:[protein-PII] uridylyltransferase
VRERHQQAGEVAFLLEPDLKEGRGGMRDVHALAWAQSARTILWDEDHASLGGAYDTLLGVRVELHRRTGRPGDRLLLQEQDAVAAALGYPDADVLMRTVAHAARTIAWTSDDAWARIESSLVGPLARARRERALGGGLFLRDGEVHVSDDVDVAGDPGIPLRAAAAAARQGTQLDRRTLARLAAEAPAPAAPWPAETRAALVDLLLAGPPALLLLEALDQQGVWERYFPEWPTVRSKPQRNAYHRYTVDRHLWEAAGPGRGARGAGGPAGPAGAGRACCTTSARASRRRPHGQRHRACWHDRPAHGPRPADAAALEALCRHHLLLADVAHPPRHRRPGHDRAGGGHARRPRAARASRPRSPRPTRWPRPGRLERLEGRPGAGAGVPGRPCARGARRSRSPSSSRPRPSACCSPPAASRS